MVAQLTLMLLLTVGAVVAQPLLDVDGVHVLHDDEWTSAPNRPAQMRACASDGRSYCGWISWLRPEEIPMHSMVRARVVERITLVSERGDKLAFQPTVLCGYRTLRSEPQVVTAAGPECITARDYPSQWLIWWAGGQAIIGSANLDYGELPYGLAGTATLDPMADDLKFEFGSDLGDEIERNPTAYDAPGMFPKVAIRSTSVLTGHNIPAEVEVTEAPTHTAAHCVGRRGNSCSMRLPLGPPPSIH